MKTLTHATAFVFAVVSSIFVTSAIASVGSAAYAVDADSAVCQQALRPATTGGTTRAQLEAMAKCRSQDSPSTNSGAVMQPPVNARTNATGTDTNVNRSTISKESPYPAYCRPLPSWVKPGDWEYREALYLCKYGS